MNAVSTLRTRMQVVSCVGPQICRSAFHRHEARAEAVDAGEILVAVALVDLALAAEFGLERLTDTQLRHRAVAAAFADGSR
jgi:hypothetical protein